MLGFPLNEEDDLERWLREAAPAQGVAPEAALPMPVDNESPPAPLPNSMRYDTRPMPLTPELEETTMAIPAGLPRNDFGAAIGDHPGNRAQLLKMMGDNSRRTFTPDEMALMPKGFQNIATPSPRPEINPEMSDPAAGDLPNTRARNDLVTGRPQMPRQRQAPDTLAGTQSGRRSSGGGFLDGIDPAIALAAFGAAVGKPNLMSAGAIWAAGRDGGRGGDDGMTAHQRALLELGYAKLGTQRDIGLARANRPGKGPDPMDSGDSAETRSWRDAAISMGAEPAKVAAMTGNQIKSWRPQIGAELQSSRSAGEWDRRSGESNEEWRARQRIQTWQDIAKERRVEAIDIRGEGRREEAVLRTEGRKADVVGATDDAEMRVPGWERTTDAPKLPTAEISKRREASASLEKLRAISARVKQIDKQMTPADRLSAMSGRDTQLTAEQMQLQKSATTELRAIANMGVPSLSEMAIANAQAPELTTVTGWVNGATRFGALVDAMDRTTTAEMAAHGYVRPARAPRKQPAAPAQTRFANPDDIR